MIDFKYLNININGDFSEESNLSLNIVYSFHYSLTFLKMTRFQNISCRGVFKASLYVI